MRKIRVYMAICRTMAKNRTPLCNRVRLSVQKSTSRNCVAFGNLVVARLYIDNIDEVAHFCGLDSES